MQRSAPAPYGRSCVNCARTKCRCILRGKDLSCERCHRLNKQCVPAPHTRKRGDKRRTRTADLEEKIEDLVTLLKTRTGDTSTTPQVPPAGAEPACFSGPGQPTPSPSAAPTPEGPYLPIDLSSEEEAMCLELFRTEYLAYFPFVHIPDGTTPRSFKASRPVLWLVVVGLTCRSTARRVAAMGRVEEVLAGRIVVGHERGVDVLLGIVAVLGWLGCHRRGKKPYMWLFIHMAMGIAGDLGLDRPAAVRGVRVISMAGRTQNQPVKEQTLDETRAVLGCYIICSVVGGFFQRPNPMPWSPTLHRCLERLRTAENAPRDQLLMAQAQMQRLEDEMALSPWRNPDVAGEAGADVSPVFYIRSMSARLEGIVLGVTDPEVAQCLPLRRAQQTTQLVINELILHTPPPTHDTTHLPHLHAALSSARNWFDTFFSTPPNHHAATPFSLYGGFLLACQMLHQLTLLEAEGWDRAAVRGVADLLSILDRTADVLAEVPKAVGVEGRVGGGVGGEGEGEDLFYRAARWLRGQRAACAAVLEAEGAGAGAAGEPEVPMDFEFMGFEEELWTADMFGWAWMGL